MGFAPLNPSYELQANTEKSRGRWGRVIAALRAAVA
jgi:hypothetical protein